jgi:small nuclear ribonucleoprotein (snRNP)-like protein
MTIDLSQYVGKTIVVELRDQSVLAGPLEKDNFPYIVYPYKISGWLFTESGVGKSKPRIIKILTPFEDKGIAQKAPNINLDDFVGQKVYVKLGRGSEHITRVTPIYTLSDIGQYRKNGTSRSGSEHWSIVEIYGKGAYTINTKTTFDNPNDNQIEQAKQLLSQMSEEQVAKLLKSLK